MSRRIVTQFMASLDELSMEENKEGDKHGAIVVIGATSRPDSIDPGLRFAPH